MALYVRSMRIAAPPPRQADPQEALPSLEIFYFYFFCRVKVEQLLGGYVLLRARGVAWRGWRWGEVKSRVS